MVICPYCDHDTELPVCGYCKAAVPVVEKTEDKKVPDNKSNKEEN